MFLMQNLTLRQLRYFDALARHGHFGRAAEASAISQPALSMQVRELEEAFELDAAARRGVSERYPLWTDCDRRQWERVRALWAVNVLAETSERLGGY